MENKTEEQLALEKKEKERLKKEAAAKLPLPKYYYDVKIEAMLPATLTYRVLAENAEQAAGLIKHAQPIAVKHRLHGRKELKLTVYDAGTVLMRFFQNLGRYV
jgi:hypothetical protein